MTRLLILFAFTSTLTYGQIKTKMFVEELALFYLDSLMRTDKEFYHFSYFTNGYIDNIPGSHADTNIIFTDKALFKNPFENLSIIENQTIKCFSVPKRLRKKGGKYPLTINRYAKSKNAYFIEFDIRTKKNREQTVKLIIDLKGNLIRREIGLETGC